MGRGFERRAVTEQESRTAAGSARVAAKYVGMDAERYERRRYGGLVRRWNLRALERALSLALAAVAGRRLVLDAPCGTGILAEFLLAQGCRTVGTDLSPTMLAVARQRGHVLANVRADLEHLPYRPASFDGVLCIRYLMLLRPEDRQRVMRALAGLSRGPLIATICHPYTFKNFARSVRYALGGRDKRSQRLTRRQLVEEAAAAGLRVDRVITVMPVLSEVWVVVMTAAETARGTAAVH